MSKIPERGKDYKLKSMGQHNKFLSRITKTLYYGKLPKTDRLSLPVSELASELYSEAHQTHSLNRLYCEDAAAISRNACISPCSFVLALLYLERLKNCNPEYLKQVAPSKLFLISLMVSSKFLHDDGEEDEVFVDEWAKSGEITVSELCQLEKEFLNAIDWNVFVREPVFWNRLEQLETDLALRQASRRGWFTYTEIKYLSNIFEFTSLLQTIIAIYTLLAATYAVGVLTIAGSVFLTSQIPGTALHPVNEPFKTNESSVDLSRSYVSPVHVLKTGIILASISCNEEYFKCEPEILESSQSWEWWNNPIMNWLYDISRVHEFNGLKLPQNYYKNFAHDKLVDMSIARQKILHLEDKIHKATKVRLQEQLERSWHEEWTDIVFKNLEPYLNQVNTY